MSLCLSVFVPQEHLGCIHRATGWPQHRLPPPTTNLPPCFPLFSPVKAQSSPGRLVDGRCKAADPPSRGCAATSGPNRLTPVQPSPLSTADYSGSPPSTHVPPCQVAPASSQGASLQPANPYPPDSRWQASASISRAGWKAGIDAVPRRAGLVFF